MQRLRCIKVVLSSPCCSATGTNLASNSRVLILYYSSLAPNTNTNRNRNPSSWYKAPPQHWELQGKDVVDSFKEWFQSHNHRNNNNNNNALLVHKVFDALRQTDDVSLSLSNLGLRLSETLVLEIFNYRGGGKDVLSCLKFFDWAGRQPGYHHTRATFSAIFKILSKQKLMSLMLDFLDNYTNQRFVHKVRFYNTLVMAYAVAGKPEVSLQLFGKMRFQGIDLDGFTYHVLLNALVEQNCFDAVEVVSKQIGSRGFESDVTHSIMMKSYCKQGQFGLAEESLRRVVADGGELNGYSVGILVDALCKKNKLEKAAKLLEEFHEIGMVGAERAYGVWIQDLVRAGRLDGAIEFLNSRKDVEAYVPDVFRYNTLIYSLLRENRLQEVCDLVMEMKEQLISPDEVTMNAVLCFFCKAGMVDVALELYNSRAEFGLSPNSMAYNFLINTLCGDGSVNEAYHVLKNSIDQGFFPGKKTFSILADALCREGKFDKMKELVVVSLERNFMPSTAIFDKFISALCRVKRVEDGYLIHGELSRLNRVTSKTTYFHLIHGFNNSNRGDISARLLIEMQEKGHSVTRKLYRSVIRCVFDMENPEKQFFQLLEIQLSHHKAECQHYNYFIDGAGNAGKPEMASKVYEMMVRSGLEPNLTSDILLLKSFLKSKKISEALSFFDDLSKRRMIGRKLSNTIVVGLSEAERMDVALDIFWQMREKNVVPSLQCYEELVKVLCKNKKYSMVVKLLEDLVKVGRQLSSYLCNTLLLHSLKGHDLYYSWVRSRDEQNEASTEMLDHLIGSFSSWTFTQDVVELEEFIEQLYTPDIFTYNMLLKILSEHDMDLSCELFGRLCQKGYEPNQWTYDILVRGFFKHGRKLEARKWIDEMFRRGFAPIPRTKLLTRG